MNIWVGANSLISSPWRGSGPSDPSLSKVIGWLAPSTVMENPRAAKFTQRLGLLASAASTVEKSNPT
jgi:hypothetical protein